MTNLVVRRNIKTFILMALTVLAVTLSWLRPIDDFTEGYLNESIKSAAIIFGISRGINAAVSVTQSAEVSIGLASVAPGEAFDPINDLIERFSEVMTFSIASLVFQKILLGITAHWFFNALVTLSAGAFIITLVLRKHEITALKVFAILVIVRLFLSLVILANSTVDNIFLDSQIQDGERNIRLLETQVSKASADAIKETQEATTNVEINSQILEIDKQVEQLDDQKSEIVENISKLNAEIDTISSDRPWWAPDFLSSDLQVREANNRIEKIEIEIAKHESKLRDVETTTSALNEERECLQKQAHGKTCSWLEALSEYGGRIKNKVMIEIPDLDEKVDDLITLMALIVIRSILLPLLFWVLIYKTIKWIWAKKFQLRQA